MESGGNLSESWVYLESCCVRVGRLSFCFPPEFISFQGGRAAALFCIPGSTSCISGQKLIDLGGASMAWEPWQAGELPLDPRGFPIPVWKHLLAAFPDVSRKVTVALPCIGAHALGSGLRDMDWNAVDIVYAWDVDPSLLPYLMATYGPIGLGGSGGGIGWGGDLLLYDVAAMMRVDFLITGPPCPPFSTIGLRGAELDSRELVFQKVTDCIVHQGWLGCYGFILEMVPGIAQNSHRPRGNEEHAYCCNYYEEWLRELQCRAPMWRLHTWELDTADYLPQSRKRLYTVGIHRNFAPEVGLAPPSPPRNLWRAALPDILHKGLCPIQEGVLSPQQRQNIMVVKQQVAWQPIGHGGCISCISADRDPHQNFGLSTRHDGLVGTLRTQNELVWLYRADAHGATVLSRCLHPAERFALQGFRPEVAAFFSKADGMRISGNAFSVPVVTHVFRHILECFMTPEAFGFPGVPHRVHRSREPAEVAEILYKASVLNLERSSLAILERELMLRSRKI